MTGHRQPGCLRRTLGHHAATAALNTALGIVVAAIHVETCIIRAAEIARHPLWWARYARARRHPCPGIGPVDGSRLTPWEARTLHGLGRAERSRT